MNAIQAYTEFTKLSQKYNETTMDKADAIKLCEEVAELKRDMMDGFDGFVDWCTDERRYEHDKLYNLYCETKDDYERTKLMMAMNEIIDDWSNWVGDEAFYVDICNDCASVIYTPNMEKEFVIYFK